MRPNLGALASADFVSPQVLRSNRLRRMGGANLGWLLVTLNLLALSLLAQGLFVRVSEARTVAVVSDTGDTSQTLDIEDFFGAETSDRDSLMLEIRRYSAMVAAMRDSLARSNQGIQLTEDQRLLIEKNIEEVSQVIDGIGSELQKLEFEVKGNTISFVNEAGEGIVINIPENLDEHLSEGLEILSKVILSELPDSVEFDQNKSWDWSRFAPHAPPPPRKVVHGNVFKVWDDLQIPAKDDIRGNVVVVFGNSEVAGRVDGNVVVVFGNLLLDDTAEVTGKVVSVGGLLDQDGNAEVGDIVSVDLWPGDEEGGLLGMLGQGILPFLMCQGAFLLTVLLAVIAVSATPGRRFDIVTDTLRRSPGASLGLGLVLSIVGHLMVALLMAVLILTVIGIPLALLVFLALIIMIILSVAVCGAVLGARVCRMFGGGCSSAWLTVVVGMSVLHLASFLGSVLSLSPGMEVLANVLVVLGLGIKTLAFLLGLGAVAVSRFGTRQPA